MHRATRCNTLQHTATHCNTICHRVHISFLSCDSLFCEREVNQFFQLICRTFFRWKKGEPIFSTRISRVFLNSCVARVAGRLASRCPWWVVVRGKKYVFVAVCIAVCGAMTAAMSVAVCCSVCVRYEPWWQEKGIHLLQCALQYALQCAFQWMLQWVS